MKFIGLLFKFFASFRCAVILIVMLALTVAGGTLIESAYGTTAAQVFIYRTPWFGLMLLLLALNLFASAVDRWPWQKKHVGFLATHLGIILLLVGSFLSQQFGTEGQLTIQEGTTESRMTLQNPYRPLIEVLSPSTKERWTYSLQTHPLTWEGRIMLKADERERFQVTLLRDYPLALREEKVVEAKDGLPALHIHLSGMMADSDEWLIRDHEERGQILLGPAAIRFTSEPFQEEQPVVKDNGRLKFVWENGKIVYFPLHNENISKDIPLGNTGYTINIHDIFRDAVVEGNELKNKSDAWRNPAVQFTLTKDGNLERHTVFSNFPDFPTIHGRNPDQSAFKAVYEGPSGGGIQAAKNELRFLLDHDGKLVYESKHGDDIIKDQVHLGESQATGWMDFHFVVDQFFPSGQIEVDYVPLPPISKQKGAVPVVQVEITDGKITKQVWLEQGIAQLIPFGHGSLHAFFGLQTVPLGFQVELKDFIMDTDPGTNRPAAFKSEVTLKDPAAGVKRDQMIQMNEPLKYRGWKVYQSAYRLHPNNGPDISIFTVAKDPGIVLKYLGSIIIVLGIALLFYVRSLSSLKASDPKLRRK
ncbi:MAG: hypothetical protein COV74_02410 [Candidatus Omnitrophica bacterium CG11_big_fil_rev_8_21_14_0_20_45_26]|uniref:ResB-like domain-containing protein n=1 Tax=Candidatus Abzuiibacterium crystallinum TaxID=1974748 RepID=A0A2H0LRM4_9BACT|nr:MAG: hypothetical protein COV74_02410 [Candidatus Omnitrophica bacterium CG11_big_fil_rev_8_21_14_0_20_45_26]PIW64590.1 MAG: hypothetical protein COW12_05740 [Candidatus Omnitrophica bacterium CG12_big_fil_rev_8_21_14_0_65_45_16]